MIELPAIVIGEEGRGRKLGVLPYKGQTPEDGILREAKLSTSRSGRLYGGEPFVQFINAGGVIRHVSEWDEFAE